MPSRDQNGKLKPLMDSFIIYDTEFTAWPGSQQNNWRREGEHKEIIQLAALKVQFDGTQLQQLSSINILVRPTINSKLSQYIIDLTGIHQALLDDHGVEYASCARQFFEFCEHGETACFSWGPDHDILKSNHQLNELPWQYPYSTFRDLKACLYKLGFDYRKVPSGGLAESVGVIIEGRIHNALYDVKSIVAFLNKILETKELNINSLFVY